MYPEWFVISQFVKSTLLLSPYQDFKPYQVVLKLIIHESILYYFLDFDINIVRPVSDRNNFECICAHTRLCMYLYIKDLTEYECCIDKEFFCERDFDNRVYHRQFVELKNFQ